MISTGSKIDQNDTWQSYVLINFAEVTVIIFVEFAVGIAAIGAGFGYRHTYIVSD